MPSAICDICKTVFPGNTGIEAAIEKAKEHEKIKVNEGDYQGVALSDVVGEKYYFFTKTDTVDEAHNRIYFCTSILKEEFAADLTLKEAGRKTRMTVPEIETRIAEHKMMPLQKEDLQSVNYLLTRGMFSDYYSNSTVIRTVERK